MRLDRRTRRATYQSSDLEFFRNEGTPRKDLSAPVLSSLSKVPHTIYTLHMFASARTSVI